MSTFCGQNMGAGRYDRVRKGFRTGLYMALVYAVVSGIVMFFAGEYISMIFLNRSDPKLGEILAALRRFIRTNACAYLSLAVLTVCRFSLQGLEHGIAAMFAGVFELAARSVVALVFTKLWGFAAICWANPIAWTSACVLLVPAWIILSRDRTEGKDAAVSQ